MARYTYHFVFILFCFLGCREQEAIQYFEGDIRDAFRLAERQQKKVFVLITNGDCGSCKSFDENLTRLPETLALLKNDYVCYRADARDSTQNLIAEIVKCPGAPFPYFFDAHGNLLAFGFPNKREFDISNLDSIIYNEVGFEEVFQLPLRTDAYKRLVSLNMKATLLIDSSEEKRSAARQLLKESLRMAAYPYNVRLLGQLSSTFDDLEIKSISAYRASRYDRRLYGDLDQYMLLDERNIAHAKEFDDDTTGILETAKLDLGRSLKKDSTYVFNFRIVNRQREALTLVSVQHTCDCITLAWPKEPILPRQGGVITARFTPYESGDFVRDIYVHSSFKEKPMQIFSVTGSVKE